MARKVNTARAIPTTVDAEIAAYGNMAPHNVEMFDAARKGKVPTAPNTQTLARSRRQLRRGSGRA